MKCTKTVMKCTKTVKACLSKNHARCKNVQALAKNVQSWYHMGLLVRYALALQEIFLIRKINNMVEKRKEKPALPMAAKQVNFLERKVAVSRGVVEASYCMTAGEKAIIYIALAKINQFKEGTLLGEASVTVEEYANIRGEVTKECNETAENAEQLIPYRKNAAKIELNAAIKRLFEQKLTLSNGEVHRWIYFYKTTNETNESEIRFGWAPSLIPYLEALEQYSNLYAQSAVGLRGTYSHRLLELISGQKSRGRISGDLKISLKDLKFMWALPESYDNFTELNRRVLKPSIKELKENGIADIKIEYKKDGKTITGLIFIWSFLARGQRVLLNALEPAEKEEKKNR